MVESSVIFLIIRFHFVEKKLRIWNFIVFGYFNIDRKVKILCVDFEIILVLYWTFQAISNQARCNNFLYHYSLAQTWNK